MPATAPSPTKLPVVSVASATLLGCIVAAIDAVSPALVNVADPTTSPVNSTVTAELSAVAVSMLPMTVPVKVASVPSVPALRITVPSLASTSPSTLPTNFVDAVIVVPVIAAAPPTFPPITTLSNVPPVAFNASVFNALPVATVTLSFKFDTPVTVKLPPIAALLSVSSVVNAPVSLVVAPIEPVTFPVKLPTKFVLAFTTSNVTVSVVPTA